MASTAQVVLVHGAWHGSWCWEPLREVLEKQGIKTHAPDLKSGGGQPEGLTDFYTDTQAVRQFADSLDSPVVLVGHSYGGHVVSDASAGSTSIRHLVMISTVMFDVDEVWKDIKMPSLDWIKVTKDGKALEIVDKNQAVGLFFNRCSPSVAAWAAGKLHTYMGIEAISQKIRDAGWKQIPSTYVLCSDDRALDIRWQRLMAERATYRVELDSDHSPFLCMPEKVAETIAAVVAGL